MEHCHHILSLLVPSVFGIESLGLIVTLFLTGLAGSFTHCIGMCGPIAMGQMSMRLMHVPATGVSEINKMKSALLMPYYLGKTITYSILTTLAFFLSESFKALPHFKYLALTLLILTALFFIKSGISKSFSFLKSDKLSNFFANKISFNKPYGAHGLIQGMTLGLIPCGLVYASIVLIIANTENLIVAITAMLAFGIATIPGLFLIAYAGNQILTRWAKSFSVIYSLVMFLNAYLLINFSLKLF